MYVRLITYLSVENNFVADQSYTRQTCGINENDVCVCVFCIILVGHITVHRRGHGAVIYNHGPRESTCSEYIYIYIYGRYPPIVYIMIYITVPLSDPPQCEKRERARASLVIDFALTPRGSGR